MGTKVPSLPGYYSMRDLNDESSSCGWHLFYGDKTRANGKCYHNHLSSSAADACSTYDKDVVKQMMLEHEAIFKNQVFELHRLYRIQRDLMDEVKIKELHRNQKSAGTLFSSGPLASQITSEDAKKWHTPSFPTAGSSASVRPTISATEGIHSPLCPGINKQARLFSSPNGSSSKDVVVLESRPSKVRRKMFDLHLPADEYIDSDESEKDGDENISGTTIPDRNCKHGKGDDVKLFFGNTGSQEDTSRSDQSLRSRNGLADLNEPVQAEETNDAACISPPNHNPYQGEIDCSAKQKSRFLGFPREDLLESRHSTDSGTQNNGYLKNDGSGNVWIPSLGPGLAKSNSKPIPQVLQQEQSFISTQTMQDALNKGHRSTSDYLTNRSKADLWMEKTAVGLDISEKDNECSTDKHPESVTSLHSPGLFAIAPSSDFAKSWSHSSWETGNSSLNQKLISVQTPPSSCPNASGALSRNSGSLRSNGILGDSWPLNINSKRNPGFHHEGLVPSGFYPGTSSVFKEQSLSMSAVSYDHLNHNNDCKKIAENFNNGLANYYKSSNSICKDIKSGNDINLNVLLSNGSSNDPVTQSGLEIIDGEQKHERQLAVLPWLKARNTCKNESQYAGSVRSLTAGQVSFLQVPCLSNKDETGKRSNEKLMNNVSSGLCPNDLELRTDARESSGTKKILGVPIFDMPRISAKESSSITFPSVSVPNPSDIELVKSRRKSLVLDINLPCDADVLALDEQAVTEINACKKGPSTTEANSRNQIDLNLSMNEDEAFVTTMPTTIVKMKSKIDLECPSVPETDGDAIPDKKQLETPLKSPLGPQSIVEQPPDVVMKYAAESIVFMSSLCCNRVDDVMSSPSKRPMMDPLNWFADVVSSSVHNLQRKFDNSSGKDSGDKGESSSEGLDYFESMTLQLPEIKEEDYMLKPLVPEDFKVEETGTTLLPTRARKGPARRGRQRRDFQRDILPGLSSLSRHEVTEDLQTFGGLMKATGHAWHSGLARRGSSRNGCGRGKRRSQVVPSPPPPVATIETCTPPKQQLNNIEVGLEDRSLTGWGKTTRRPRRQRYPAGNPPSIWLI